MVKEVKEVEKIVCDKCLTFIEVKKEKKYFKDGDKGKVVIHFFRCSHCSEKYPFDVESDEINRLIKKRKKLYIKTRKMFDQEQVDKAFQEIAEMEKSIKALHEEFKLLFKLDKD